MIKFSNIADIIFMTKEDINNLGLKNYKTILYRNYKNKIIVFRLGNGKINVFNKGNLEKYKVYLVKKVKDTTACGDAFNACFLYNYFNNCEIKDCVKLAHRLGKNVANFKGAIIPKKNFNSKSLCQLKL